MSSDHLLVAAHQIFDPFTWGSKIFFTGTHQQKAVWLLTFIAQTTFLHVFADAPILESDFQAPKNQITDTIVEFTNFSLWLLELKLGKEKQRFWIGFNRCCPEQKL